MSLFNRHLRRIVRAPAGIAVAIGGALLSVLLATNGGQEAAVHDAILTSLQTIEVKSASLQRDALKAKAGLEDSFAPLQSSVEDLRAASETLAERTRPIFSTTEAQAEINDLAKAVEVMSVSSQRFQSLIHIAHDAFEEFSHTVVALRGKTIHLNCQIQLTDVLDKLERFAFSPSSTARDVFERTLASSTGSACAQSELDQLSYQGQALISTLPLIDDLLSDLQDSATFKLAQRVQNRYLQIYGETSDRSFWAQVGLLSLAMLLCVYISFLAFRLERQTVRLERRLALEAVLSETKSTFDCVRRPEKLAAAVQTSLDKLAAFFGADKWGCEIISLADGATFAEYTAAGHHAHEISPEARRQFLHFARTRRQGFAEQEDYHTILQLDRAYSLGGEGAASGLAVGISSRDGTATLFVVAYPEPRLRLPHDTFQLAITGLRTVFELHANAIERHERLALEQKLEHGERLQAVGRLAGGIAHEFNNILGALTGYGEMALRRLRGGSKTRYYVEQMEATAKRGQSIVDQILTLSRRRQWVGKPFNALDATHEAVPLIGASLPPSFQVTYKPYVERAVIEGHPFDLQQVLLNLCRNAYQARRGDGAVSLEVRSFESSTPKAVSQGELQPGKYVQIVVADNGLGIRPSVLPHIFEPFYTTRSFEGGTGLGLATALGTVTAMKGAIDVESRPGHGTRFSLYFHQVDAQPEPLCDFLQPVPALKGQGETVAVIHDRPLQLSRYEESLAALGYEPIGFPSCVSLIDWLQRAEREPDALLVDIERDMPALEMFECLAKAAPIIFVLDADRPDLTDEHVELAQATLVRPIKPAELSAALLAVVRSQ